MFSATCYDYACFSMQDISNSLGYMKKFKTLHIHSDHKFVGMTRKFENAIFENSVVIIGDKVSYKGIYKDEALFFRSRPINVGTIINLCHGFDIIVLYDLTFFKCIIANRIPSNIIVLWRFFGYELYGKIPKEVFSNLTAKAMRKYRYYEVVTNILGILKVKEVKQYAVWRTFYKREFTNAINRINYFMGLSNLEYEYLKNFWPNLPKFIQWPLSTGEVNTDYVYQKSNKIMLGNNRSAYNNHLDILDIISKSQNRNLFNYYLFFSYGENNNYAKAVRNAASKIKEVHIIEEFLPIEEFRRFYSDTSALVINGYRQMAMGNIFEAIRNGVKVYLNERNIILARLKNEGFLIYTIEDFVVDLEINNIAMPENDARLNLHNLQNFIENHGVKQFYNKLCHIVYNAS